MDSMHSVNIVFSMILMRYLVFRLSLLSFFFFCVCGLSMLFLAQIPCINLNNLFMVITFRNM